MVFNLELLATGLAICRFAGDAPVPQWVARGRSFASVTRTSEELSIVIDQEAVPRNVEALRDYRAFRVVGRLDPHLVGVLDSLARPLAAASVPIFAISTYETDYLLVRAADLDRAIDALKAAGHRVRMGESTMRSSPGGGRS